MNIKLERLLLLAALITGLSCAWLAPIDTKAEKVVDDGLTRALVGFGSARVIHATLSVVESTSVGVVTIGKVASSANDLVGKLADVMLAACIAFGIMKVIIAMSGSVWVSLLLSLLALWLLALHWADKGRSPLLSRFLLLVVFVRFAMPLAVVGSEAIFQGMLAADYEAAQKSLSEIPRIGPSVAPTSAGQEGGGISLSITKAKAQVEALLQFVEIRAKQVVHIITIVLLQTLLIPLFLLWIFRRVGLVILDSSLRTKA